MTRPRKILIGAASSGALLMLAACGSSSSSTVTVTTTASASSSASTSASSSPAAPTPTATQGSGGQSLPAAPAGAKELQTEKEFGGVYARYEISGKTPADVEADYKATLEKDGYKVSPLTKPGRTRRCRPVARRAAPPTSRCASDRRRKLRRRARTSLTVLTPPPRRADLIDARTSTSRDGSRLPCGGERRCRHARHRRAAHCRT